MNLLDDIFETDFLIETGYLSQFEYKPPIFQTESIISIKHLIYNEIAKVYLNEKSIVKPIESIFNGKRCIYQFEFNLLPNDGARFYTIYKYGADITKEQMTTLIFKDDLIKLYNRQLKELLSKYFDYDKPTETYTSYTPLLIWGDSLEDINKRLKSIETKTRRNSKSKRKRIY